MTTSAFLAQMAATLRANQVLLPTAHVMTTASPTGRASRTVTGDATFFVQIDARLARLIICAPLACHADMEMVVALNAPRNAMMDFALRALMETVPALLAAVNWISTVLSAWPARAGAPVANAMMAAVVDRTTEPVSSARTIRSTAPHANSTALQSATI